MSSRAFIKQYFLYGLSSKSSDLPVTMSVTVCLGTSTLTFARGLFRTVSNSSARNPPETCTGRTKLLSSLILWISANELEITTLKP